MPKKSGPNKVPGAGAMDRTSRMSRSSLAAKARELLMDGDLALQFYIIVASRQMPEIIFDKQGRPIGVQAAKEPEPGEFVPDHKKLPVITIDQMMLAIARITERGWGQAPQHQVIEQEVKATITAIHGGVDPQLIGRLPPEALKAIRDAVKRLPSKVEDAEDAEFVEVEAKDA